MKKLPILKVIHREVESSVLGMIAFSIILVGCIGVVIGLLLSGR